MSKTNEEKTVREWINSILDVNISLNEVKHIKKIIDKWELDDIVTTVSEDPSRDPLIIISKKGSEVKIESIAK